MIRLIDIRLNAAHPELKLPEAVTYTGAPSTALIRGVPPNYGRWAITAVYIAASFPDGTTMTRTAVQSANGVWVATLPATATSGRTTDGFRVIADGIDENGEAATGYILAVADFAVASLAVTPAPEPGETSYQMLYFDEVPSVLRKGDVTKIDGVLKFYNGTAWEPFTDLSNYYTAEQVDEAIDKLAAYYITADAQGNPFATHAALVNAQTYYSGGAARTPTRNDYAIVLADETHGGAEWRYIYAVDAQGVGQWEPQYAVEGVIAYDNTVTRTSSNGVKSSGIWAAIWGALTALPTGFSSLYDWCVSQLAGKASTADATLTVIADSWEYTEGGVSIGLIPRSETDYGWAPMSGSTAIGRVKGDIFSSELTWGANEWDGGFVFTAFRTGVQKGYVLGSQTYMAVASETEAEALRQGKADNNAVVHLTGNETIDGTKTFTGGVISDTDGTPLDTTSGLQVGIAGRQNKIRIWQDLTSGNLMFHRLGSWEIVTLKMVNGETIAFAAANPTAGNLAALDANGNPVDSDIPAANVALKADLRYAISESIPLTVTSGAASTTLNDRTHNVRTVAAPGSGNTTTITATLPPIITGKSRDMFLNLTVGTQASDAGNISLSIVEPSGATAQIDIGSVEDIGIGKNEILISENALPTTSGNVTTTHWLVTVRHEDFES